MTLYIFRSALLYSPVCLTLMLLIAVVSISAIQKPTLLFNLMLHPYSVVRQRQYYRLLTGDWVHNDWFHLGINEFVLFAYGTRLEQYLDHQSVYGDYYFLLIYLCSCLSGSVVTTWIHRKNFDFAGAGVSGSVMGCMFSLIVLQPHKVAFYVPVIGPVANIYGGLLYILGMVAYERRSRNKYVNQEVHFYGALGGLFATWMLFGAFK
jgi:membrane associated rhomboid family serine protease